MLVETAIKINNDFVRHLVDEGGEEGVLCSLQVQLFHLFWQIFIVIVVIRVIIMIMVIMIMIIMVIILARITLRPVLQTKLSSAPHLVKINLQT